MRVRLFIGTICLLLTSAAFAVSPSTLLFKGEGKTQSGVHGRGNVYAPDVQFYEGKYWMWFGGQGRDGHDRIHLAQSTDGRTWKQLGVVLDSGSANHVNDPSLVRVGDQWFMYYTVATVDIVDEIALATSKDGFQWEKKGVVLSAAKAPAFDSLLVGRPSVLRQNGKFRTWYDGRENLNASAPASNAPKVQHSRAFVGYAESDDGLNWTRKISKPDFEATALHVSERNGHLLAVYESHAGTRYATSNDGISWHDHGMLFAKSSDFDKFGQVTPFLFSDPVTRAVTLYFGGASEAGWDANVMAMVRLNPAETFEKKEQP